MDSVSVDATIASQVTAGTVQGVGRATRAKARQAIAGVAGVFPDMTVG